MYEFKCKKCKRIFRCNVMISYCPFCGNPLSYAKLIVEIEVKEEE